MSQNVTVDNATLTNLTEVSPEERRSVLKAKFDVSLSNYNNERFDEYEVEYLGNAAVRPNRNSNNKEKKKKSNNVRPLAFQMIESQVDTTTYQPKITANKKGFEPYTNDIRDKIKSDLKKSKLIRKNDLQERNTYVHGIAHTLLEWDMKLKGADYIGDKDMKIFHAKQVIPQANIYDEDEMDYFFIAFASSKKSVMSRYDMEVISAGEEYPEFNQLDVQGKSRGNETSSNPENELVTEIICFYIDDNGNVGKMVMTENEILEDSPEYYYPRMKKCSNKDCNEHYEQSRDECPYCKSKAYTIEKITEEEVEEDIELEPLSYIETKKVVKTRKVPITDDNGAPMLGIDKKPLFDDEKYIEEVREEVIIERTLLKGDIIPVFVPKMLPLVSRRNITKNFDFAGISDIEIISDQLNEIKKTLDKASEKVNKSTSIIKKPKGVKAKITTENYQVLEGDPKDLAQIGLMNLNANAVPNLDFAERMADVVERTLGISQSYQGQADTTAKSGKAKLAQIQQTEGRLASKRQNKRGYYERLFRMMFYFDMAFMDEPRLYSKTNSDNEDESGEFDKRQLLFKNKYGEWEYMVDFNFEANLDNSLPTDPDYIYDQAIAQVSAGLITKTQYWTILEKIGFPGATQIVSQLKEEEKMMQEQANPQPDVSDLPPEIQKQAMADPAVQAQMSADV